MSMSKSVNKLFGILLCLCMILQFIPATAFAESAEAPVVETEEIVVTVASAPETDLPDNDELFAMYAEQTLYGYESITLGTSARDNLNAVEQGMYDALKARIEEVAAAGGSTAVTLSDISGLKVEWTNAELGVDSIEDTKVVKQLFAAQFSLDKIVGALLSDCPFDLYWYDKSANGGTSMRYAIALSAIRVDGAICWTSATISNITFQFRVAEGYCGGNDTTVTSNVVKVRTAKAKAQSIVDSFASCADHEKLSAYKDEICNLVAYNDAAAKDDYTGGYGDPWQLIYVFDGDSSTKVVCEGYAKAFQYLCDLGGMDCISVNGEMTGDTNKGRHMWNIVTLDGANYLVDVTNCDAGTVGEPDALFLRGNASGSAAGGYTFNIDGHTVIFTYDAETLANWKESQLTLAATDYSAPAALVCTCETKCAEGSVNNLCAVCAADLTACNGKEAECRHTGGTDTCVSGKICQLCGAVYGDNPNGLGHNMGDWVVTKEPTTAAEGEQTRSCRNADCDYTETESIPKLVQPDGWAKENGSWYYYENNEKQTGWKRISGSWYYMNADGVMQTGWVKDNGTWYYLSASGVMQTGWVKSGGSWYYMSSGGAMQTGWVNDGGKWYYMSAGGAMQTGWVNDNGKWYYLNSYMQTGWQKIDNKWYYLKNEMKTGWQFVGCKWYYLNTHMQTGWLYSAGKWYYLDGTGAMVTGTHTIGGKSYTFNANGVWIG